MKYIIGLALGIAAAWFFGPTIAVELQWPVWVVYILIAVDGLFLSDVPYQFSEFFASQRLRSRGYSEFADGCAVTLFFFALFGLLPLVVLGWLVWVYLSL